MGNANNNKTEFRHHELAIGIWENEGGAVATDAADHQYGRRVEVDRTWTTYNVFSGVPAFADGHAMIGLSRSDATSGMLAQNLRNVCLRKEQFRMSSLELNTSESAGDRI